MASPHCVLTVAVRWTLARPSLAADFRRTRNSLALYGSTVAWKSDSVSGAFILFRPGALPLAYVFSQGWRASRPPDCSIRVPSAHRVATAPRGVSPPARALHRAFETPHRSVHTPSANTGVQMVGLWYAVPTLVIIGKSFPLSPHGEAAVVDSQETPSSDHAS
jgi:hypothetical protein